MSQRKFLQVSSIDAHIAQYLQTRMLGNVLRCYHHVITIQTEDQQLLHLVHPLVGNGPRRWVIHPYPEAVQMAFNPGMRVMIDAHTLQFENGYSLDFQDATIWRMPPVEKTEIHLPTFLNYLKFVYHSSHLEDAIAHEHELTKAKLRQFFFEPSPGHLEAILGLGSGSTPIGDDAIFGYLLSQRFLGRSISWIAPFAAKQFSQTTLLSQEMLMDVYLGNYSQRFIDWIHMLIHDPSQDHDALIKGLGGHSGFMILSSFYHFMIQSLKEEPYEHIFTYSR